MNILYFIGWAYIILGLLTLVASIVAVLIGEGLEIQIGEDRVTGWRYWVGAVFLFMLVFMLWPLVLYQALKD